MGQGPCPGQEIVMMSRIFPQLVGPLDWTQGWPAGWTVGGLLARGLPAFCPSVILCALDWAASLQGCYPHTERGAPCTWAALRVCGEGLCQSQKPQQPLILANGGGLEMDIFFFLAKLTFGISGCWPNARPLWPSACQLL